MKEKQRTNYIVKSMEGIYTYSAQLNIPNDTFKYARTTVEI